MSWKVRSADSNRSQKFSTAQSIVDAIIEGILSPTDRVKADGEADWQLIEEHPQFREVLEEIDLSPPAREEESSSLDMNPLIDVCLVLLIFFMLTTTYVEMRRELPAPPSAASELEQAKTEMIKESDLKKYTLRVTARKAGTEGVEFRLQDKVVQEANLESEMTKLVQETGLRKLAVEIFAGVPWGSFVAIQDAAAGAGIEETIRIERPPTKE